MSRRSACRNKRLMKFVRRRVACSQQDDVAYEPPRPRACIVWLRFAQRAPQEHCEQGVFGQMSAFTDAENNFFLDVF